MVSLTEGQVNLGLRERFLALLDSLSALKALSLADITSLSEEGLFRHALETLVKHEDMGCCSIFVREGDELYCVAGTALDEQVKVRRTGASGWGERDCDIRFRCGEGIVGIACETRQLQYCRNCQTDQRFKTFSDMTGGYRTGSLISVPICFADEALGVLNVSHPMPEFFESWQQHMLLLFGTVLGQMLHNQRMHSRLDRAVQERTRELEQALQASEELRSRYEELSTLDALTGLHNRRYFFSEAIAPLASAMRYRQPLSLLLMDVDNFKRINDEWGHAVGDQALCKIAEVLQQEMRAGDVVARLGGEEFVVLLPNTGPGGADLLAARIQQAIGTLDFGGEQQALKITVSIGMAALGEERTGSHDEVLEALYSEADAAMYECKRKGRNRRSFANSDEEPAIGYVAPSLSA
jgi:diguanylate cyclase (GGDEF)-like protein